MCNYIQFHSDPLHAHTKVLKLVGKNKRVLEIGCATGYLSKKMREKGCEVWAVEIDKEAAEIAKKYVDKIFVVDIEEELPNLPLSYFDVIVLADVLEHLKNSKKVLEDLKKFLAPEGRVIISVPNIANWHCRLMLLKGQFNYEPLGIMDETHLRFFTLKSIQELIKSVGLSITKLDVTPDYLNEGGLFTRAIRHFHISRLISYWLTKIFKGFFAFQFIIVAKKKNA